jgi:uncharacterized damage-inducible protein DinB
VEDYDYGRFGWVFDPEGNKIELWQDAASAQGDAAGEQAHHSERPTSDEYDAAYAGYVAKVPDGNIIRMLRDQPRDLRELIGWLDAEKAHARYAEGKWTIAQVAGHMIDGERVFGHRFFCVSRGEKQSLPGFDEQEYIAASHYDARSIDTLVDEFELVRKSNLVVAENLTAEQWVRRGMANGKEISVRALIWITAGHVAHHMGVLRERYLGLQPK